MRQTILIVDDVPTCRELVGHCLRSAGYRVLCAADGREALRILEDHSPDLILLDMAMPRLDGLELLKEIRRSPQWRDLPVILFTGSGSPINLLCDGLRVDGCILKAQGAIGQLRQSVRQALTMRTPTAT